MREDPQLYGFAESHPCAQSARGWAAPLPFYGDDFYFGITSWASLLATTSRISLRFLPASIMASRDP